MRPRTSGGYGMQLPEDTIITAEDPAPAPEPAVNPGGEGTDQQAKTAGGEKATDGDNTKEAAIKSGAGVLGDALSATALLLGDSGGSSRGGGNQPGASQGDVPYTAKNLDQLDRIGLTPDQRASMALAILSKTGGMG